MLFIGGGVPKTELLGTPAREFSKTWNLVRTEDTYRATGNKILNEIRPENFEKSIVEKGSLLPTNDHIETGIKSLVDYKGLLLFIGGGVPKFELLGTPAREFAKTWNLVSIEDTYRATGKKIF